MGGKHYYCDYCDRFFKDAAGVRKKHLSSMQHIKNRDNHYNLFKDPKKILEEELGKNPCKRFLTTGECQFESVCRYTHYTPYQIAQLQAMVAAREGAKRVTFPDPEQIVREFFDNRQDPEELAEENVSPWPVPKELVGRTDLPPSMKPMTYKDFDSADFPEWGWR